jgi:hypothetical protein
MPSSDTETPRRSSEITGFKVDNAIGLFNSEDDAEGELPGWMAPPTGHAPAFDDEIHPATERGTTLFIGTAVLLLVTVLAVVLIFNRQHPLPRLPLELKPPTARTVEPGTPAVDTATVNETPNAPLSSAPLSAAPTVAEKSRPIPAVAPQPDAVDERLADVSPSSVSSSAADTQTAPLSLPQPITPALASAETSPLPSVFSPAGQPALDALSAATVPPPPAATTTVDPLTGDQAAIRRALDAYRESYSALDASAVSLIWVGLDTKALQRAFSTLSRQDLEFEHCDLDIAAARNRAHASCTGVLNYVRRIGSADEHQRQMSWGIDFVRSSDRWLIENVTAR